MIYNTKYPNNPGPHVPSYIVYICILINLCTEPHYHVWLGTCLTPLVPSLSHWRQLAMSETIQTYITRQIDGKESSEDLFHYQKQFNTFVKLPKNVEV